MFNPKIELKNIKTSKFQSQETACFEATVYVDGVKSFTAHNDGNGGCNNYYGDNEMIKKCEEWVKTLPKAKFMDSEYDMDLDLYISNIMDEIDNQKQIKKWCKTKTVFQLPDSKVGEYLTINCAYSEKVRTHIMTKHPNAIILNEGV
jgi:hypothetical protein